VEEEKKSAMSVQSLQRFVDPRDIATLAVFLASDAGKSISGAMLPIDNDTQKASSFVTPKGRGQPQEVIWRRWNKTPHLTKPEQQRLVRDFFHFIAKLHEPPLCLGVARPPPVRVSGLAKVSATVGGESYSKGRSKTPSFCLNPCRCP
jgi:hypothetical protein